MHRSDRLRLQDIRDLADECAETIRGVTQAAFLRERPRQRIVERLVELVGEAASHLTEAGQAAVDVDWRRVRGVRNILAHQYGHVDHRMLYVVATRDLPGLRRKVAEALEQPDDV